VDVARAVHLMFTELHEECLTEEHYYHIVSECLRAMRDKFNKMLPTADQKLRNFITNLRLMWDSWNDIVPLPKAPFIYDYTREMLNEEEKMRNMKRGCEVEREWKIWKDKLMRENEYEKKEEPKKIIDVDVDKLDDYARLEPGPLVPKSPVLRPMMPLGLPPGPILSIPGPKMPPRPPLMAPRATKLVFKKKSQVKDKSKH